MKQKLVISCPASSRSGYGDHSRDIIRGLVDLDRFEISILDQRWGNCPRTEATEDIAKLITTPQILQTGCDVWMQVTVPNEFQRVGKQFNIGVTAGIETDRISPEWIEGCNRMDMIIVPSAHAKIVLEQTVYDKTDKDGNKIGNPLKVEKPVHILFEGLDTKIYDKMESKKLPKTIVNSVNEVKEEFCFLSVGHWLQGEFGQDRKDISGLILTFLNTFKGSGKKPGLILKTSAATFSVIDREDMLKRINAIKANSGIPRDNMPNIYLLHGDLTPEEMNGLYNHHKVKAMVSFTHGEGYGRPLLEFSVTGKPTLATDWSGHRDFLTKYTFKLPGELKQVHSSVVWDKVILKDSRWFYADYGYASKMMKDIFKKYKNYLTISRKQRKYVKDNFSMEVMVDELKQLMNDNIPEPVKLTLPKLKKFPVLK